MPKKMWLFLLCLKSLINWAKKVGQGLTDINQNTAKTPKLKKVRKVRMCLEKVFFC